MLTRNYGRPPPDPFSMAHETLPLLVGRVYALAFCFFPQLAQLFLFFFLKAIKPSFPESPLDVLEASILGIHRRGVGPIRGKALRVFIVGNGLLGLFTLEKFGVWVQGFPALARYSEGGIRIFGDVFLVLLQQNAPALLSLIESFLLIVIYEVDFPVACILLRVPQFHPQGSVKVLLVFTLSVVEYLLALFEIPVLVGLVVRLDPD